MRISVNLATRPFIELRPLFARLRLAMAALTLLAVVLGVGLHVLSQRAKVASAQMDALKGQTTAIVSERQSNEQRMQQPQNKAVLDRSKFLNSLFAAKSFSWTAVLMDLERVVPGGVQVTSIEPTVTPEGNVNIRLRVNGPRDLDVDFLRNLERSQRFVEPRPANETAQNQEQGKSMQTAQGGVPGGVEFDILSGYNPLPLDTKAAPKDDPIKAAATHAPNGPSSAHKAVGSAKKTPAAGVNP
jgi:type IV pilus assembly protein PilN